MVEANIQPKKWKDFDSKIAESIEKKLTAHKNSSSVVHFGEAICFTKTAFRPCALLCAIRHTNQMSINLNGEQRERKKMNNTHIFHLMPKWVNSIFKYTIVITNVVDLKLCQSNLFNEKKEHTQKHTH